MSTSSVPEFTIRELTGQRRTVVLTQRGLPFRPLSLSGTQRVEVTTPPGSPDGISSVTGPTEEDTTIHGKWSDKWLGAMTCITNNTFQVHNVIAAVRLFDDIRISGQLLHVSWGPITRTGHISKFEHSWDNIHDVDWTVVFKWINRGNVSFTDNSDPVPSMVQTTGGLRALLDKLIGLLNSIPVSPFSEEMDDLFALAQKLRSLSDELDTFSSNGIDTLMGPLQITNNFRDALMGFVDVCLDFGDKVDASFGSSVGLYTDPEMQSQVTSQTFLSRILNNAMPDKGVDMIVPHETDTAELKSTVRDMRNIAIEAMRNMRDPESSILGTYTAREGDNLRDVSSAFYGTPQQWRSLMIYNQLDSAELEAGDVVVVPKLDSPTDGR